METVIGRKMQGRNAVRNRLEYSLWDRPFVDVVTAATRVRTHQEYFGWLQDEVNEMLPHTALCVAWGDFVSGNIDFDIASVSPVLNTTAATSWRSFKPFLVNLYTQIHRSGLSCITVDLGSIGLNRALLADSMDVELSIVRKELGRVLIYHLRDERSESDTLFVFSIEESMAAPDVCILDLLVPQIDATLRGLQQFKQSVRSENEFAKGCMRTLSAREREVLHWVGQGKSNDEIGVILGISHNTVKNHLKRIFNKLSVSSRSQAVRRYMQGGDVAA